MPRLRVRYLYLGDGEFLAPAEITWSPSGRVLSLRKARGTATTADVALFPGFVNAHVHLQISALTGRRPRDFVAWLSAVMRARADRDPARHRRCAEHAVRELLRAGTTAVGEIDSTGQSPDVLRRWPLGGRCYQELTGFDLDRTGAAMVIAARSRRGSRRCPAGLSPHAPYSASAELIAGAARRSNALAIHVAEHVEEQRLLRTGRGAFAELLRSLGRLPTGFRPPRMGAVRYLDQLSVLRPGTQLVHCQELERGDAELIAASGATITVCPGTIRYLGRSPPPLPRWLERGIPIALGTDSAASNKGLSMTAELAAASRMWPAISPVDLLAMATGHGARALCRPGLGRLRRGGAADMFSVAAGSAVPQRILEGLATGRRPVVTTWIRGRVSR